MPRTPEQKAADDNLTAAIEQLNEAYFGADGALLTDYVIVSAWQRFDDDGYATTQLFRAARDEGIPVYRQLGLLEQALLELRVYATAGDSGGSD